MQHQAGPPDPATPGGERSGVLPALRQDIELHEGGRSSDGSPTWVLVDPASGSYFHIGRFESADTDAPQSSAGFDRVCLVALGIGQKKLAEFFSNHRIEALSADNRILR